MRLFSDAASLVADPFLRRAFTLAELGRGTTSPNPLVGCVIVRDGLVVGEGWHERAGGPHAEVVALAAAGDAARGATAYVTLEPCAHTGRTGPCTIALSDAGVAQVVIGMSDPNPSVAGGGAGRLREAGITVRFAADPAPFVEQNEAWLKHVRTGMPWVQVKTALTLDGHASLRPGEPARLSGPEASLLTMRLRAAADAVVAGAGTLAADDPSLTVRGEDGTPARRQPLRVALSRSAAVPPDARVFTDGRGPALAVVSSAVPEAAVRDLENAGVRVERYHRAEGVGGALRVLGDLGLTRLLVEAGPGLFEALWEAEAIDELVAYHCGGVAGMAAPALVREADEAEGMFTPRLAAVETGMAGDDAVTVWRPRDDHAHDTERE